MRLKLRRISYRFSVSAVVLNNRAAAYPNKEDVKLLVPGSIVIVLFSFNNYKFR